jgi:hypothetical protein
MAFTPKTWENEPSTDTPISAAALIDAEDRVTDYADSVAAGGIELGYAAITSDATRASTSYADVSGLSVSVTVGTRPILVTFSCPDASNSTSVGGVAVAILEDGSIVGNVGNLNDSATFHTPLFRAIRRAPSAGSHTYKAQLKTALVGTATLKADSGGTFGPTSIQVIEI